MNRTLFVLGVGRTLCADELINCLSCGYQVAFPFTVDSAFPLDTSSRSYPRSDHFSPCKPEVPTQLGVYS